MNSHLMMLLGLLAACASGDAVDTDSAAQTDADTDVDADTDSDADGDTDTTSPLDTGPFDADEDGVFASLDCDDGDPSIGAPADVWDDADGDGHGSDLATPIVGCPGPGLSSVADDCDDTNPAIYTGAAEVWCNGDDDDCVGGSDDFGGRYAGVLYPVLQDALDAAPDGSTVEVCVSVTPAVVDHPLILTAAPTTSILPTVNQIRVDVASGTVEIHGLRINMGMLGPVVDPTDHLTEGDCLWIGGGADVLVEGGLFTACGPVDRGAAVTSRTTGVLTLDGDTFDGLDANVIGGALFATGDVVLQGGTTFTGNTSDRIAGAAWIGGTLTVTDTASMTANTAVEDGGALVYAGPMASVAGLTIDGNTGGTGGGVKLEGAGSWTGGIVSNNIATDSGGGMFVSGDWTVDSVAFDTNQALGVAGGGAGAALDAGSSGVFDFCTFDLNDGAAGTGGGGLRSVDSASLIVADSTFTTNFGIGGGLFLSGTPNPQLTRVTIDQTGGGGEGMRLFGTNLLMVDGSVLNGSNGVLLDTTFGGPGSITSIGTSWISQVLADVNDTNLPFPQDHFFWSGMDFTCDETACTEF